MKKLTTKILYREMIIKDKFCLTGSPVQQDTRRPSFTGMRCIMQGNEAESVWGNVSILAKISSQSSKKSRKKNTLFFKAVPAEMQCKWMCCWIVAIFSDLNLWMVLIDSRTVLKQYCYCPFLFSFKIVGTDSFLFHWEQVMISDDKIVMSAVRLESDCFTGHCKICLSSEGFAAISCSVCSVWGITLPHGISYPILEELRLSSNCRILLRLLLMWLLPWSAVL